MRQLRVGVFTKRPAADSIRKLTSRFIISSISTYITLLIAHLPKRYDSIISRRRGLFVKSKGEKIKKPCTFESTGLKNIFSSGCLLPRVL